MRPTFRCPHCSETLVDEGFQFRCRNGHSFDRAKEGYVNLLPSGRLRGRPAGDEEGMVRARREVFDARLYQPIIARVAEVAAESAPDFVLDAGCGEGSYLAAATRLAGSEGWGIDISKAAVKMAARRSPDHHYAVASSYSLPFADRLFDVAINVFSPRDFGEMGRVLNSKGYAIVVTPGPDHLRELKARVYDDAFAHGHGSAGPDHLVRPNHLVRTETVSFDIALPRVELRLALLRMTPFWWSATPQRRADVAGTLTSATVDVCLSVYAT